MLTRQEYDSFEDVNYSTLSKVHRDPRLLLVPREGHTMERGQLIGSLVDCLMFSPDEFTEKFFTSSAKMPAEKMNDMLVSYLAIVGDNYYPINTDAVLTARQIVGYANNYTTPVVLSKFEEACTPHLMEKQQAGDRIVVDQQLVRLSQDISTKAMTNPFVMNKLNPDKAAYRGNQVCIRFTHEVNGMLVSYKTLLDNLVMYIEDNRQVVAVINDGKFASKGSGCPGKDRDRKQRHARPRPKDWHAETLLR